jgi:superfamily II DNA or RNA helicase
MEFDGIVVGEANKVAMNLFEHNRFAYSSVATMLAETGKAAVIHPTGTGKSFIGFKLCEDHPD